MNPPVNYLCNICNTRYILNVIDEAVCHNSKVRHGLHVLTYICNVSFQTGIFLNKMKIPKIIPLYKNGNKHIFTNYRPVSLLPQFSKILEKLFNDRLEKFIDKHDIINESQYGLEQRG